jgi:hypothetical protein
VPHVRDLVEDLRAGLDVPSCADDAGAPVGHLVRRGAARRQLLDPVGGDLLEVLVRHVARPHDRGAEDPVEQQVAGDGGIRGSGEHQLDVQAEPCAGRRRQPGVVALRGAGGDQGAGTLVECLGTRVSQLADLVAATAQPHQVVALQPEVAGIQPDRLCQAWRRFDGGGNGGEVQRLHGRHPAAPPAADRPPHHPGLTANERIRPRPRTLAPSAPAGG